MDQGGRNSCDANGITDFKFTTSEVAPGGANDVREFMGKPEILPVIHAHANQHFGMIGTGWEWFSEVVVTKQPFDRCATIHRKDIAQVVDWDH